MKIRSLCAVLLCLPAVGLCHDTWVEVNTPVIRIDDVVHVDLKLGNHGNDHRDFKLASKISLAPSTLTVIEPKGATHDLKDRLVDLGFTTKEGYWSARFVPTQPGLHIVGHTVESQHGKTRGIKAAKTYFMSVADGPVTSETAAYSEKPLGHPLELVPLTNPVLESGPNRPIRLKLLFEGKPLSGARVSFVPRGQVLAEGVDSNFERTSDAEGFVEFTPSEGNVVLAVVHHLSPDRSGDGYDKTQYSATLTIAVPQRPYRSPSTASVGR